VRSALYIVLQFALSLVVMLIPTTLMGATFPMVSRAVTEELDTVGLDVGTAYSANTLGSTVGSIAAGFLLIPLVGVKATVLVAACVNGLVAAILIISSKRRPPTRYLVGASSVGMVALLFLAFTHQPAVAFTFDRMLLYGSYEDYKYEAATTKVLYEDDGLYGRVAVVEPVSGGLRLHNGGNVEGSSYIADTGTESLLALVPLEAHPDPKTAMVIGLGTGYTPQVALTDTRLDKLVTVEINPSVVIASRFFVGKSLEKDPRYELALNDGRNYLLNSELEFDVITTEPSWPTSAKVSHLFTQEFFELAHDRLAQDGVFCQWLPRYIMETEDTYMMLKTFHNVFPNMYVYGVDAPGFQASDVLLIGIKGDRKLDTEAINAAVAKKDPTEAVFAVYETPESVLEKVSGPNIPTNTDDRPLLEFRTPQNRLRYSLERIGSIRAARAQETYARPADSIGGTQAPPPATGP